MKKQLLIILLLILQSFALCKYCGKETKNPKYCSYECWHKHSKILGTFSGKNNPFYGKTHSKKTREKLSKNRKGKLKGKLNPNWKPPKIFICEECGLSFESKYFKKYCSKKCRYINHSGKKHPNYKEKIKKDCLFCKKEFSVPPCLANRTFCSQKCYWIGLKIGLVDIENMKKINSKILKKLHKNLDFQRKRLKGLMKKPNKKELLLNQILQKNLPNEYKYVGDGQVIFGNKCPDWINCNGQKKLIELFGDYWHRNDDPQNRINHFKQYGFDTLVIWENELENQNELIGKLRMFNND